MGPDSNIWPCFFKMKKIVFLIVSALLLFSCGKDKDKLTAEVYRLDGGYGYKIIYKDRILIKQTAIPSLPGNKKFCDSIDAVKVSNEVVKLLKSRKSPTITGSDLQRLKIKLKC
jgi:Domain of unknown function (DUF4907)